MTRDYHDLEVRKLSMTLCEDVYALLRQFPQEERYALCDQLRRAVVSIPSNITPFPVPCSPFLSSPKPRPTAVAHRTHSPVAKRSGCPKEQRD